MRIDDDDLGPDLSPMEKFWSWLRWDLRRKDLTDLRARRPLLSKARYEARVRAVRASVGAQRVAANVARNSVHVTPTVFYG